MSDFGTVFRFLHGAFDPVEQRHRRQATPRARLGLAPFADRAGELDVLAIEGERDDISGLGQTKAALTIATKLPKSRKQYFMAKDVGHYGIFNGRKWREQIAPVVEKFIQAHR